MAQQTMDYHGYGNIYLTALTVFLFFITRFGVTEWAGIATILAAASTLGLNIFRYFKERKPKNHD